MTKNIAWKTWLPFGSYVIVGATSVAVQFATLAFLVENLALNPAFSSGMAFFMGCLVQYLLLYYWTFRSKGHHKAIVGRYALVTTVTLVLNVLIFWGLTDLIGMRYLESQALAASGISLLNFFFNRSYTFIA